MRAPDIHSAPAPGGIPSGSSGRINQERLQLKRPPYAGLPQKGRRTDDVRRARRVKAPKGHLVGIARRQPQVHGRRRHIRLSAASRTRPAGADCGDDVIGAIRGAAGIHGRNSE